MKTNPIKSQADRSMLDDILKSTSPTIATTSTVSTASTAPALPGPRGARGVFGSVLGGLGNLVFPGLGTMIGGAVAGGALGAAMPTLGSETAQYLVLQRQIQLETLAFETASTVMKVRHDAALHCIQNMK